ncbi:MAG: hypothetical protein ABR591_07175 [Candidatus Velthaea sp.]
MEIATDIMPVRSPARDYVTPEDAIDFVPDGILYDARRDSWIVTFRRGNAAPEPEPQIQVLTDPASSKIIEVVVMIAPFIGLLALWRFFLGL